VSPLTLASQLAHFVQTAMDGGVPTEVRDSVRQRFIDTFGIALAASTLDTSVAIEDYARSQGGRPEAQAIGVEGLIPAALAALVNGSLAHSLDYDDTHLPSVLHPSASVLPAVLATCQAVGAQGRTAVAAAAAGLEICVRLGMVGYDEVGRNSVFFDRGQHATSICGAIAGAAAAAGIRGLDEDGISSAMGIAASMASGIIEGNRTGGTVKRIHCGWAAHAAVTASDLAARGITGPPTVFEGRFGFFQAFLGDQFHLAALTDGLGESWEVPGIFFKPYPANHFTHAGIDAAAGLRRRGLRADDVESLALGIAAPTLPTIGEPIDAKRAPMTGYQAQFSGPYTVVASLLGGGGLGLGLDDFTDLLALDPFRRELMARVTVAEDPRCSAIFPNEFPAVLVATTHDGHELREEVLHLRGGPARPLTDAEIATKFSDNAGRVLPPASIDRLLETIEHLEGAAQVHLELSGPRGAT
jgi:2-methylcitrate dehydratase PrpD